MIDPRDTESLLNDILAEPGELGLRNVLLDHTLRAVKRRRVMRRVRSAGSIVSVFMLTALALLVWRGHGPRPREAQTPEKPYVLVHTARIPAALYVDTRPLSAASLVVSHPSRNMTTVATASNPPTYQVIDDATLLALAAPKPAVLVRHGPHVAQLIFVPETANRN